MKERSPVKKNILKLIPFIEIIAGIIFLCLEIHDYRTLYSMAEADAKGRIWRAMEDKIGRAHV